MFSQQKSLRKGTKFHDLCRLATVTDLYHPICRTKLAMAEDTKSHKNKQMDFCFLLGSSPNSNVMETQKFSGFQRYQIFALRFICGPCSTFWNLSKFLSWARKPNSLLHLQLYGVSRLREANETEEELLVYKQESSNWWIYAVNCLFLIWQVGTLATKILHLT